MAKQLADLFDDFLQKTPEDQVKKIEEIRVTRAIERPATVIKKQKKERVKVTKKKATAATIAKSMTDEDKLALLKMLEDSLDGEE